MAGKYLGPAFDIHGGGIDLFFFPHHENEIAQSRADGQQFSAFWLHNAWVTLAGEKMSKSLGNVLSLDAVTQIARPIEVRYYLSTPHYRSTIAYSEEALAEAVTAYRRIEDFVVRASEKVGEVPAVDLPEAFVAAMDDDLGVPRAVAVVHARHHPGGQHRSSERGPSGRTSRVGQCPRHARHPRVGLKCTGMGWWRECGPVR